MKFRAEGEQFSYRLELILKFSDNHSHITECGYSLLGLVFCLVLTHLTNLFIILYVMATAFLKEEILIPKNDSLAALKYENALLK